jgi:membrane-bound lytic murein transglycosylase D
MMQKTLLLSIFVVLSANNFAQNQKETAVIEEGLSNVMDESVELYKLEYQNQKNYDSIIKALGYEEGQIPLFTDSEYCLRLSKMDELTPFQLDCHSSVLSTIRFFNEKRRNFLKVAMGRSALYFSMFEEALDRYQMPLELKYLSVIESGLRPQIRSRAGALGLWQFMYRTGKMYGLEEDAYIDERMDPYKATDAACRYLKRLHAIYNDWNMALAAYNAGPGNVNKAIYRSGGKSSYWEIRPFLPIETQGYVPNFIAVCYLIEHAAEHNILPAPAKIYNYQVDTVCLQKGLHMKVLDSVLNWPIADIQFLNPIYKTEYIPQTANHQCINIPKERIQMFIEMEDSLYKLDSIIYANPVFLSENDSATEETVVENKQYHKVKSGENLGVIAEKYHTTVSKIMETNHLRSSRINVNQTLIISSSYTPKSTNSVKSIPLLKTEGEKKYYTVQNGDSLWSISKTYEKNISEIQALNPALDAENLKVGQKIRIQ